MKRPKRIRYHKCSHCGKKAVWLYMPSGSGRVLYCDDCVPRGCSCNNHDIKWDGEPEEGREVVWLPKNYKSLKDEMTKERQTDSFHYQYLDKGRLLPCGGEYLYDEEGFEIEQKVTLVNYNRLREVLTATIKEVGCPKLLEYAMEMLSKCNVRRYNIDYNEFMQKLDHINHGFFSKQYTRVLKLLSARMQPYRSTMWLDDWEEQNIGKQNSNINVNKSRREESTENTGVPAE